MGEGGVSRGDPTIQYPIFNIGYSILDLGSPLLLYCSLTIQNLGLIVVGSVPSAPSRNRIARAPWDPPAVTTV